MFLGQMRKPDKEKALKELKSHVVLFGVYVAFVRAIPYVLNYIYQEPQELSLEF